MLNRFKLFIATVALLTGQPGTAWATQSNWELEEHNDGCSTTAVFEDGTRVTVGANKEFTRGWMSLWNPRWASIEDGRSYSLRLDFDGEHTMRSVGTGMTTDAGSRGVMMVFRDLEVVGAVAVANGVSIWREQNLLGSYSLRGSQAALGEVARCIGRLRGQVTPDPFAE